MHYDEGHPVVIGELFHGQKAPSTKRCLKTQEITQVILQLICQKAPSTIRRIKTRMRRSS